MKKFLLLLVVCLSFTSCLSTKRVSGSIYKKRDKFQQCNFYMVQNPLLVDKNIDAYIVESTDNYIRLVFLYYGKDWIFFDRAILLNKNDETISYTFNSWEKETDVISSKEVKEKADVVLSREQALSLKELLEGGFVRLRLQGKSTKTYIVNTAALQELLKFYFEEM